MANNNSDSLFLTIVEVILELIIMPFYMMAVIANLVAGVLLIFIGLAPFIAIGAVIFFLLVLLL